MPRTKQYDDELLVRLIAEGKLTFRQVGEQVGISGDLARRIARGELRKDLQPLIRSAWEALPAQDRPPQPWGLTKREPQSGRKDLTRWPRRIQKDYDDDLLVSLIGEGSLTYTEIAKRVGISFSMVSQIARGVARPDLQARINAASRGYLEEMRRSAAVEARKPAGDLPAPAKHRLKEYDDNLLVRLLAAGELNYEQIALSVGISRTMVSRIASGQSRPQLHQRIRELVREYQTSARRMAVKWLKALLSKQIKNGIDGSGETARKCREFTISKFLDDRGAKGSGESDDAPRPLLPIRSMTELSPPLFAAVLKELGGPELGPEDYENYAAAHKDRTAVLKELGGPERGPEYFEAYPGPPDLSGEALRSLGEGGAKTEDTTGSPWDKPPWDKPPGGKPVDEGS